MDIEVLAAPGTQIAMRIFMLGAPIPRSALASRNRAKLRSPASDQRHRLRTDIASYRGPFSGGYIIALM